MNDKQITDFQRQCEQRLSEVLAQVGKSISSRSLGGETETYITGTIAGDVLTFWIYADGADFKSPMSNRMFEKCDYKSLDELAQDFIRSVLKTIEKKAQNKPLVATR